MILIPSVKDMLSDLITTPSISSSNAEFDTSNKDFINVVANWLFDLKFRVDVSGIPGRAGKFNLVATLGEGENGLLLSGHSDTVPVDEGLWNTNPFVLTESDEKWFGLGTCDMKGFFPLVFEAIKSFHRSELKRPLSIVITADEECGMWGARALRDQGNVNASFAVIGEPTGLRPIRAHKGVMFESLNLFGESGHSSAPENGKNAIESLTDVTLELSSLRKEWASKYSHKDFDVPAPTLNFGLVRGGDNPNRICGQAELQFDVRPTPGMLIENTREDILKKVEKVVRKHQQAFEYVPLFPGIPPFETMVDSALVSICERLSGKKACSSSFATEAPFFQDLGIETVILGPGYIDQAHQPNEFLPMSHAQPTIEIIRKLVGEICT